MKQILLKTTYGLMALTLSSTLLWSHGGEKHEKKKPDIIESVQTSTVSSVASQKVDIKPIRQTPSKEKMINKVYQKINLNYLSDIKPIFEKKCFDCHGTLKRKPWYYDLPVVSYIIQKDMEEAKEHTDMRKDFPFVSHETPYNDLKSIKKIGLKGGMPPLQYILGHWDARLTDSEKEQLVKWSEHGMKLIEKLGINTEKKSSH